MRTQPPTSLSRLTGTAIAEPPRKPSDRAKGHFLMSRAWRVIRVSNEEVRTNLEGCVAFILAVAAQPAAVQKARPW